MSMSFLLEITFVAGIFFGLFLIIFAFIKKGKIAGLKTIAFAVCGLVCSYIIAALVGKVICKGVTDSFGCGMGWGILVGFPLMLGGWVGGSFLGFITAKRKSFPTKEK